jgi:AraC-like DNA-binding protein/mannose-6-phosphate isomerase-like protein (cupin superfamily)
MSDQAPANTLFAAKTFSHHNRSEMRQVLEQAIKLADREQLRLRVPREVRPDQKSRTMHYHYRPEIFLQITGRTDFRFPREGFTLGPGEMGIIPAGVPHAEAVFAEGGKPFRNLVAGFYNNTLSLHFAHETAPQRPDIEAIEFFDAPHLDVFLTLTKSVAHTHFSQGPARSAILKGLLIALLGMFRNIVETGTGNLNGDTGKVYQAKCLVREQYANPKLSVQSIAGLLGCSPDYLSHLFHVETKERLTHYIQRIRIEGALIALETTSLNISEIAYSSGFADPAYFARVFKQRKGVSPHEHRLRLDARHNQVETQPKTVYHDHVDFSPGAPAPKAESAAGR